MKQSDKVNLVPIIQRHWDHVNNCEPTYPMPCIVWWEKGYSTEPWYKGELLCEQFPNGELYSTNLYLENLVDSLTELYQEVLGDEESDSD